MARVTGSIVDVLGGGVDIEGLVWVLGGQAGDVTGVTQQPLPQWVATLVWFVRQLQPAVLHTYTQCRSAVKHFNFNQTHFM